jgi:hypothetical protein
MMKRLAIAAGIVTISMAAVSAQEPKPKPADPQEQAAAARTSRNVSLELTITDQSSASDAAKKVVSMIVGDGHRGSIRTSGRSGGTILVLNVDARPRVIPSGNSILTELTIEYMPKPDPADEGRDGPRSQLNQSMALVLESGKPTIISQAADPASSRKITVEVKATILK